jgi:spermidine synthase
MEVNTELINSLHGASYAETACSADTTSLYSISSCIWAGRTSFCNEVVIAESPVYGRVLFLDKEIQSAESDEVIYHEHLVHPVLNALAGRGEKRVLIVGGGEGATAREVLKWSHESVALVDWVDIDGGLVDLCRRHLSWADDPVYNDQRLHYFAADIREFWASNDRLYDIVILDLPDPDVEALAEAPESVDEYPLYSRQFMRVLRSRLANGGAFVSHCGPVAPGGDPSVSRAGLTWMSEVSRECGFGEGAAYHTCIPSFQGDWGFFMSVAPVNTPSWPEGLAVMDLEAQTYAFTWPRCWNSPYVGHADRRRAAS